MRYQLKVRGTLIEAEQALAKAIPGAVIVEHKFDGPFIETLLIIETETSVAGLLTEWVNRCVRTGRQLIGHILWWRGLTVH